MTKVEASHTARTRKSRGVCPGFFVCRSAGESGSLLRLGGLRVTLARLGFGLRLRLILGGLGHRRSLGRPLVAGLEVLHDLVELGLGVPAPDAVGLLEAGLTQGDADGGGLEPRGRFDLSDPVLERRGRGRNGLLLFLGGFFRGHGISPF